MKVEIKDIKEDQVVYDKDDMYKAYANPRLVDGIWHCEITDGGDYAYDLIEGKDEVWDNPHLN
jgi:hypothetical protein